VSLLEEQLELFEDLPEEKKNAEQPLATGRCAECEHITAVRFSNSTLFFCSMKKGGRFGKKIKKSSPACNLKITSVDKQLTVINGYFGGKYGEVRR
jgi:hypothetical protein